MNQFILELKANADEAKYAYKSGQISRQMAAERIKPYINEFNIKSTEIAKKYGMKPKLTSLAAYLR